VDLFYLLPFILELRGFDSFSSLLFLLYLIRYKFTVVFFGLGVSGTPKVFIFKIEDLPLGRLQSVLLLVHLSLPGHSFPMGLGHYHLLTAGFLFVKLLERIPGHCAKNRKLAVRWFLQGGFPPLFSFLVPFEVSSNISSSFSSRYFPRVFTLLRIWLKVSDSLVVILRDLLSISIPSEDTQSPG